MKVKNHQKMKKQSGEEELWLSLKIKTLHHSRVMPTSCSSLDRLIRESFLMNYRNKIRLHIATSSTSVLDLCSTWFFSFTFLSLNLRSKIGASKSTWWIRKKKTSAITSVMINKEATSHGMHQNLGQLSHSLVKSFAY